MQVIGMLKAVNPGTPGGDRAEAQGRQGLPDRAMTLAAAELEGVVLGEI